MHTIESVDTFLVDLPTIRPHVLSMATMMRQTAVFVRIHCSDGIIGTGEATTIGGLSYGPESPEGIKLAIDTYFAPLLVKADSSRPAAMMTILEKNIVGNHFAKCAVETALLDAMGRRLGVPISELLGGRRRDSLVVAWTLASGNTAKDIAEAERMLDIRRHNIFKIKIGKRSVDDDVMHVAAIKKALGDRASIRVDVNQAWDEASAARAIAIRSACPVLGSCRRSSTSLRHAAAASGSQRFASASVRASRWWWSAHDGEASVGNWGRMPTCLVLRRTCRRAGAAAFELARHDHGDVGASDRGLGARV